MADDFVPQLVVTIAGTELDADAYDRLTEVRAETSVQIPDQITLRFIDDRFELYDRSIASVGDEVAVSISAGGSPQQVADCDITAIGLEPSDDGGMTLVIRAHGLDHALCRGVDIATFLDQTDSEIASAIASAAGLSADTDTSSVKHPHVMQMGPANRFLDERAACVGFRWWVEGRTLYFKQAMPSEPGPTLVWGQDLLTLRMTASSVDMSSEVQVRSWDPDTQSPIVGTASPASTVDDIGTDASGPRSVVDAGRSTATFNRFRGSHPVDDDSSASGYAAGLARTAVSSAVNLRGSALGDPAIRAGRLITIDEVGSRLSGSYRLARVEHVYAAGDGYTTYFETGGQNGTGLVDLLRGPAPVTSWSARSLVTGLVTNISDPERPARVKVSFPTYSDTFESAWARLVQPGAGQECGLQIHPDVGDEVLVGFEHGDPSRPVVLGGLWSRKLQPPLANDDVVQDDLVAVRSWKSRAGHSITINDNAGSDPQSVVVELADGKTRLVLAEDRVELETPSDLTITTKKDATISADGDIAIEGNNISIKAAANLSLEGNQLTAKGSGSTSVEGAQVAVKASAQLTLDGGPMAKLTGGMVQIN